MPVKGRLKGYFLRGMAVLLPTILTIWIFVVVYTFIQDNISHQINRGLVRVIVLVGRGRIEVADEDVRAYLLEKKPELLGNEGELAIHMKRPEIRRRALIRRLEKVWVDGPASIAGFIIALVSVCIVGALLASVVGRALWRQVEKFILNTPVFRRVYPYIKQVTDFLLAPEQQKRLSFSRVVAVEYPRKGIWSLGMVTGSGLRSVTENLKKEFLTVLVPTSPTPFTGFVIILPKKNVIDLDMTIEEAFRFLISGGVITPDKAREMPTFSSPEVESED